VTSALRTESATTPSGPFVIHTTAMGRDEQICCIRPRCVRVRGMNARLWPASAVQATGRRASIGWGNMTGALIDGTTREGANQ
jgi:hypothetical protein